MLSASFPCPFAAHQQVSQLTLGKDEALWAYADHDGAVDLADAAPEGEVEEDTALSQEALEVSQADDVLERCEAIAQNLRTVLGEQQGGWVSRPS